MGRTAIWWAFGLVAAGAVYAGCTQNFDAFNTSEGTGAAGPGSGGSGQSTTTTHTGTMSTTTMSTSTSTSSNSGGGGSTSITTTTGTGGQGGGGCTSNGECPGAQNDPCNVPTCDVPNGTCSVQTPLDAVCAAGVCDGAGQCVACTATTNACPPTGNPCTTNQCMNNACMPTNNGDGSPCGGGHTCNGSTCSGCSQASDCGTTTFCDTFTCDAMGHCQEAKTADDTVLPGGDQTTGDCHTMKCEGGVATNVENDGDVPVDNEDCTQDLCTNGTPSNPPTGIDTACNEGGNHHCDGNGHCVACAQIGTSECNGGRECNLATFSCCTPSGDPCGSQNPKQCSGTATDSCNNPVTCMGSECTGTTECGSASNKCCNTPSLAAACGMQCNGTVNDTCGVQRTCTVAGVCTAGQVCSTLVNPGTCCTKATVAMACGTGALNSKCAGTTGDGCGGTTDVDCSTVTCSAGLTCNNGQTNGKCCDTLATACGGNGGTNTVCTGMVSDGCTGMLDCSTVTCTNGACAGGKCP